MSCNVELNAYGDQRTTREPDDDDSWDRGSSHTTWSISGASLIKDNEYADYGHSCVYPGELKEGDEVYCVYAVYSTGDSFGHDSDARLEFISVHKDAVIAHDNARRLREGVRDKDSLLQVKQDDGSSIPMGYVPWDGYFESLSYLHVENFTLSKKKVSTRY